MLKVITIERTCEACPAQWEGSLEDKRMIYIRYRWGWLSVRVSKEATDDIADAVRGKEIFGMYYGNDMDGTMLFETLMRLTENALDFSKIII